MVSTYEEAKRCPKCSKPGEVRKKTTVPGKPGAYVHVIYCVTELCPWYNTPWLVQVNADGSIPPPQDHSRAPKIYQGFENHDQIARDIVASLEAQKRLETERGGHGEVRNPFSR